MTLTYNDEHVEVGKLHILYTRSNHFHPCTPKDNSKLFTVMNTCHAYKVMFAFKNCCSVVKHGWFAHLYIPWTHLNAALYLPKTLTSICHKCNFFKCRSIYYKLTSFWAWWTLVCVSKFLSWISYYSFYASEYSLYDNQLLFYATQHSLCENRQYSFWLSYIPF